MAGYFKKLNGYVYEGTYLASEPLANGLFAVIDATGKVNKNDDAKDLRLRVTEVTSLFGLRAVEATVVEAGADEVYFVENEWDIDDNDEYNEALYTNKVDEYVRMRRPTIGDKVIFTTLVGAVGNTIGPVADGLVAVI